MMRSSCDMSISEFMYFEKPITGLVSQCSSFVTAKFLFFSSLVFSLSVETLPARSERKRDSNGPPRPRGLFNEEVENMRVTN
ncbi:hypothetical protein GQ457_06G018520 [Hibiscus cannabinus]